MALLIACLHTAASNVAVIADAALRRDCAGVTLRHQVDHKLLVDAEAAAALTQGGWPLTSPSAGLSAALAVARVG
jgi:hypothetical protein